MAVISRKLSVSSWPQFSITSFSLFEPDEPSDAARARIRAIRLVSSSTSRNVIICSISLENKRSSVQPLITRSFLANRGSFSKYTIRQSHQAMKPENLIPNTMATPVRCPMVANCPNVSVRRTARFTATSKVDGLRLLVSNRSHR